MGSALPSVSSHSGKCQGIELLYMRIGISQLHLSITISAHPQCAWKHKAHMQERRALATFLTMNLMPST